MSYIEVKPIIGNGFAKGILFCAARHNRASAPTRDIGFIGMEFIGQHLVVSDDVVDNGEPIGVSVSPILIGPAVQKP